jgi:hypothetical protein
LVAIKDTVDLGRSVFDLAKNLALVAFIVVLLVWPSQIDRILRAVGIDEFEIFGLKGKTSLVSVAQQLRDQELASTTLRQQLANNIQLLNVVEGERDKLVTRFAELTGTGKVLSTPAAEDSAPLVRQAIDHAKAAIGSADSVSQGTKEVLSDNSSAITSAQDAVGGSGGWAIVYSADTTEAAASPEIERVRKAVGSPQLYLRQGWFRGTLPFPSRAAAQAKLSVVRGLSPNYKDAYIINLNTWCPSPTRTTSGVLDCGAIGSSE